MKWIIFLAKNKIPYHIYKLNIEDKIILSNINNKKILIIIEGTLIITKISQNKTRLPIAIIEKNDIFINQQSEKKIYYEVKAINHTYIMIINEKVFKQKKIHTNNSIIESYYQTINRYVRNDYDNEPKK